jgi:hypothetical protein
MLITLRALASWGGPVPDPGCGPDHRSRSIHHRTGGGGHDLGPGLNLDHGHARGLRRLWSCGDCACHGHHVRDHRIRPLLSDQHILTKSNKQ